MKLCFLANADSIHSYRWIKHFAEKGHVIEWITLTPPNSSFAMDGIKLHLLKGHFLFNVNKIKKILKEIQPDILHSHYAGLYGLFGALCDFHPFVLTVWGSDVLLTIKSIVKKPLIIYSLKRADVITCDAVSMQKLLIKLNIEASKIKIIYFGVDTETSRRPLTNEPTSEGADRTETPIVISLRRLNPIYNVETLIRTIPFVLKAKPDITFIVAGNGTEEIRLKKMTELLGIPSNVQFIGWIDHKDIPRYLNKADIYVSTSLTDTTSVSLLEAMWSGAIPIITDLIPNRELITDGENGFIVPVKNPQVLAKKILFCLNNPKIIEQIRRANIKKIDESYNWQKEMGKMETIYKQLL
ncbi:MAG TPA: hypothetical protein DDX47_00580 [Candidatus Jacksonbacteria bacterium]|nr:MAG: hypothetical protein UW45_C0019G0005 [Parcubacteria group bacterium GW2011_GWC2_44_22]OGY74643.1 MAG: hypothetical protein A2240_06000 [Candidatus Jacksonbacteria bacterium RIFOXYA2_FULL_43_12]OGY75346.1 MAG: hypothetical protein A2295_04165 [Candidatus Jacksonbacteria bacterium RIFOXYB2_FULL_44_15]OGY82044.1 MAG: hypothetical protein A2550_00540 [Candidatus Jacksonbacteria bacterium RIFOXYD2_FULL_43_21]HBH45851.1 hypothetical protein [Candidatus Jacksonbacteria bacterium]